MSFFSNQQSTPIENLNDEIQEQFTTPSSSKITNTDEDEGEGDMFWGDDPQILLKKDRLVEFFPTTAQTLPERMNSVTRLVIYISVVLSVYQGRATAAHFGILLMAMLYLMYRNQTIFQLSPGKNIEAFDSQPTRQPQNCVMPTPQNPYMNFLLGDTPGRLPACKGPGVQETAENLLDKQLFTDVDDLFSRNSNNRLFRTMPETTGLPDRERYANWLVKGEKSCKTTGDCNPYQDLRNQRQIIPDDLDNDFAVSGFSL